ncbi:MAG TPA: hypothetical protein VNI60_02520 [Pyrinomonadaceae bacterium]|nr:hypothetical protein [Pyrinomonadaceae bacterium]
MFKLNSQKEIDENYQGINISEFTYSNDENLSKDDLIDYFIHSNSFAEESRREIIKNHTGDIPFLRQAFEIDFVKISDFKIVNKNGVVQFLNVYSEEVDWGDTDGIDFIKLKDRFIEFLKIIQSDKFYLISKEWFDENDKRLRHEENWIYSYYFLIIWTDEISKTLTISEWTYD